MSQLQVTYDIPKGSFSELASKIRAHLTPGPEKDVSIVTTCELEKIHAALDAVTDELESSGIFRIRHLPWDYASNFAMDLGIFNIPMPTNHDDYWNTRDALQTSRYAIPCLPGTGRSYTIEIFGKHVNGIGTAPMTVIMDADTGDFGSSLYLLTSWYNEFKKNSQSFLAQRAIMTEQSAVDNLGYEAFFKSLPETAEYFEKRIEQEKLHLAALDWIFAVNMTRFYFDFFGKPIDQAGYSPLSVYAAGSHSFSKADLESIHQYPSLSIEALVDKILPRPISGMPN